MTTHPDHIVKSFDEQLEHLKNTIVTMGTLAVRELSEAIDALRLHDADRASEVLKLDPKIDDLEVEVEDSAIKLLALRQPMANDLREVVASLKIAGDLERIGDLAANVAKRGVALAQMPLAQPVSSLPRMGRFAQSLVEEVIDAYARHNPEKAIDVWVRDEELDEMYSLLVRELLTYMMEDARNITPSSHLMFIGKNLERIGDHATNVAEVVYYVVTGHRLEVHRPKGDTGSFQVPAAVAERAKGDSRPPAEPAAEAD